MSCDGVSFSAYNANGDLTAYCINGINTVSTQDIDVVWILICGFLVFFMQLGFTMLEVGSVRPSNVQNILFKNLADACISCVIWYVIGWPLATGEFQFLGAQDYFVQGSKNYATWFSSWCFAAASATIVSGSVAERVTIHGYWIYTVIITGFIYPVVSSWVWSSNGWLGYGKHEYGIIDMAGSGVVHMVGGWSGFMGAYLLGPRISISAGHSVAFQVFGTMSLWFGWYGFNCGSISSVNGKMGIASLIACNTTLSAASGGLTSCLLAKLIEKKFSMPRMCNGLLSGLVAITASCAVVQPYSAHVIGIIGSTMYFFSSQLLVKFEVDDVLDASCVHGVVGMWGLLAVALFSEDDLIRDVYGDVHGDRGTRVRNQFVGILAIWTWTIVCAGCMFTLTERTVGLRIAREDELQGLDVKNMQDQAWNWPEWMDGASEVLLDDLFYHEHVSKSRNINDEDAAVSEGIEMVNPEGKADTSEIKLRKGKLAISGRTAYKIIVRKDEDSDRDGSFEENI